MTALNEVCSPVLRRPGSGDSDRELFEDLFARRIHDVANGSIRVVAAVRSPGRGAVVTVAATVAGLDAAAACIGSGRCRVRDIETWFPGERITIVNSDPLLTPATAVDVAASESEVGRQ